MDIISITLGLIVGILLTLIISYLWLTGKTISKNKYDELTGKFQELSINIKLIEQQYLSAKAASEGLAATLAVKEGIVEDKIALSASQQMELRTLNEKVMNLTAINKQQLDAYQKNQEQYSQLNNSAIKTIADLNALRVNYDRERETIEKQAEHIEKLTNRINTLTSENSTLSANNTSISEKLTTQKEEMVDLQLKARLEFENIANRILEEKSGRFTEANKINLEAILKPLGENIDTFKKKVEETYDKESKQRFSLEEKVKELIEQTNKVSSEANNLATALKGQTKKQGDWGEMILESILEKSGLTRGREYTVQESQASDQGKNMRPDVIVTLPENRKIIIDSKVSLVAYDRLCSAETNDLQAIALKNHIVSLYNHVDQLSQKRYDLFEGSLDFVMMFIPIEPAYLTAIQADQELWAYAYHKRVLLISPTNLIAALKLVSDLWKREQQNKNALEIAKQGEKLYEKFIGFVDAMEDIGKHINKSQDTYLKAIGQLKDGRGNLINQALKLKNLGIKSDKSISPGMLSFEAEDPSDDAETDAP